MLVQDIMKSHHPSSAIDTRVCTNSVHGNVTSKLMYWRHNTDSEIILCLSGLVSGSSANVDQSKADLGIGDLYSTTT